MIRLFLATLALKKVPDDIRVSKTRNGQIIFEIDDLSGSNVTWFFNGSVVPSSTKYQIEIKTVTQITLHINRTESMDSGTYTAVVENGMEKLMIPVKMTVRGKLKKLFLLFISNHHTVLL